MAAGVDELGGELEVVGLAVERRLEAEQVVGGGPGPAGVAAERAVEGPVVVVEAGGSPGEGVGEAPRGGGRLDPRDDGRRRGGGGDSHGGVIVPGARRLRGVYPWRGGGRPSRARRTRAATSPGPP